MNNSLEFRANVGFGCVQLQPSAFVTDQKSAQRQYKTVDTDLEWFAVARNFAHCREGPSRDQGVHVDSSMRCVGR